MFCRFPSPMAAGAHPRRSSSGAADTLHRQERAHRLPFRGTGGLMPRNANVVFRVRGALAPGWTPRVTCAGCARGARAPFAAGRRPSFASTRSKTLPTARVAMPRGSLRSPSPATRRHVEPTCCSPHLLFSRPSTRVSCSYRGCFGGRASCSSVGRPLDHVGHPASAGRHRWFCDPRRCLPRSPGTAEPLTSRHRAGGRAEALSRPSRSRSVTTAVSRDGTAASPDPERLPSPGAPRGLHLCRRLSPAPWGSRCSSLRLSPWLDGAPLRVGVWFRPRFAPPGTA